MSPSPPRLLAQLFVDPGENRSLAWSAFVNGLLGSHAVPARVRTIGYRLAGMRVHPTALVRPGVVIRDRALTVGAHSTVNYDCVFDNRLGVLIGENVGIGIGVQFINTEHDTTDPQRRAGTGRLAPVVVGTGAYLGSRVTVLSGVTIGEGAVVAAGSVVIADCEPHGLYAGTPARHIRDLERTAP